ncbi:MAG: divalent-cation tolerance protein CutA [Methanophagales archaeon ANME-1-THS]|nr:MAG: divalent-cation tolerance protein CutA [Methanophagales archaeon ANME-1-THS]
MKNEFCVLFCTTRMEESEKIARILVEERLAACVNVADVHSYFRWRDEFCTDREALLIIKTEKGKIPRIIERIKAVHSYELPEIIALPIVAGYEQYLAWLEAALE